MSMLLNGIIPPMITPLTAEGQLDEKGLERLINHLIAGGVHGIFLLGTNGEGPSLSYKLRKSLISKACKYINGRVPILVGITDTSFEGSVNIALHAKEAGANAVVIAPPYYFPISQIEMVEYLQELVLQLPLPFVMYNMPGCTKLHLSIDTIRKAKEMGAIGIKDSSGDIDYLTDLITAFKDSPEFTIIAGTELFLPEAIANGGHGAVAGGANFFPRIFVDLYEACIDNDKELIDTLHAKVVRIDDTIYNVGKYTSRYTKGTKCTLSVMGICDDHMAQPFRRLTNGQKQEIAEYVKEFNYSSMSIKHELSFRYN